MTQPSSECTCRVVRNPLCGEYPDGSGDCNEIERGPCHAVSIEERDALRERLRERSEEYHDAEAMVEQHLGTADSDQSTRGDSVMPNPELTALADAAEEAEPECDHEESDAGCPDGCVWILWSERIIAIFLTLSRRGYSPIHRAEAVALARRVAALEGVRAKAERAAEDESCLCDYEAWNYQETCALYALRKAL